MTIFTDVAWNIHDNSRFAVSSKSGHVAIFNWDLSNAPRRPEWESPESRSQSVNRLAWSPTDKDVFVTANQDGLINLFDIRQKQSLVQHFNPHADSVRDVAFDPFNSNCFGSVCGNGSLALWDKRFPDSASIKFAAHTSNCLSLAYCLSDSQVIATGSSDKSCKVWNLKADDREREGHFGGANNNVITKPTHVIRTPAPVGRIRWRHCETRSFPHQLATTATAERGDISVWNLALLHSPVCVLRGHDEPCMDFQWIDTPSTDKV